MPRRSKIDIEKIRAADFTLCTECAYKIPPAELRRIDGKRVRCPKCGAAFEPAQKGRGGAEIGFNPKS